MICWLTCWLNRRWSLCSSLLAPEDSAASASLEMNLQAGLVDILAEAEFEAFNPGH